MLLPSSVSLMVGKRNLQRSGEWKPMNPDIGKRFGDKMEVLEYTGIEVISLIGSDFSIDFPVASRPVGKTVNTRNSRNNAEFFCYLCFVISRIFENKASLYIILIVGLLSPYTHRTIFVTLVSEVGFVVYGEHEIANEVGCQHRSACFASRVKERERRLKARMEKKMEAGQERMEKGKEEVKNQIQGLHGEIKEVQRNIEKVESEVRRKIVEVENKVHQRPLEEC
ncbi:hypothetical protein AVEN_223003-1 [Araneus ventricosus]|uniref:Uncharacterized protein n=1 Tax=Araneus ventricosus TaxID=182803 RepID=A0A4Y2Q0I9_ARAVE|nr:hypothetical protein AVEN_223003-1 [Araneus ventricosus]